MGSACTPFHSVRQPGNGTISTRWHHSIVRESNSKRPWSSRFKAEGFPAKHPFVRGIRDTYRGLATSREPSTALLTALGERTYRVHPDAMEVRPMEFHERVRQLFLELPTFYPAPVAIIDGSGTVEEVHKRILEAIGHAAL